MTMWSLSVRTGLSSIGTGANQALSQNSFRMHHFIMGEKGPHEPHHLLRYTQLAIIAHPLSTLLLTSYTTLRCAIFISRVHPSVLQGHFDP